MTALLQQNAALEGDLVRTTGNCTVSDSLVSAVVISLFTDKRVPDGVAHVGDRRGCWFAPYLGGDDWGSLLWTLEGSNPTPENLKLAEQFSVDALTWMVADGIASEVRASATHVEDGWCRLRIEIRSGRSQQWLTIWEGTVNGL